MHPDSEAGTSHHPFSSSTHPAEPPRKRLKRRVPETERRRSEASCDRCKQRKIRCIRPRSTHSRSDDGSDDEQTACVACTDAGVTCEAKLPRKQRLYASMEQLSLRYRVLDAVMRNEYSGYDLDSLAGLLSLARDKGVEVPKNTSGEVLALDPGRAEGSGGVNPEMEAGDGSSIEQPPSASLYTHSSWHIDLPTKGPLPSELRPYQSSHAVPLPLPPSSDQLSGIFRIPEGSLVPAPRGGFHYVGPGSLAYFAKIARELVTRCNLARLPSFDERGLERFLKAAEFTTFKTSQAIEAKIEGHPATAAVDEEDEVGHSVASTSQVNVPANAGSSFAPAFALSPAASSPRSTLKHQRMVEVIPDRSLSDRLVRAFFDRVHPNFTTFHQGAFQMRYESIWTKRRDAVDLEAGWVCALFMVYVHGAQALEDEMPELSAALQQRFLGLVIRDGLPRLALTASLGNVQALMLMSLYQHNAGERNAAWMMLGQAARTAVALGMHRDGQNGNFDPFERNTRRAVWWTLHMFEQNLSFALGRPGNTDLIDVSAVLPEDVYLDGTDHPPGYFERAVALTEIASRVRRFVGSITTDYPHAHLLESSCETAKHLHHQLVAWRDDLPPHLSVSYQFATARHRRAVTLLHIQCDHYLSIVGRPFLLCRVNRDIECAEAQGSGDTIAPLSEGISYLAQMSVRSARMVVHSLLGLAERSLLEGNVWLDFYYVHHAAFVFGIHFLGKTLDEADSVDIDQRDAVSTLLALSRHIRLAPTYRILMNVAMQLAYIVGIGPEEKAAPVPGGQDLYADVAPRTESLPSWAQMPIEPRADPVVGQLALQAISTDTPRANSSQQTTHSGFLDARRDDSSFRYPIGAAVPNAFGSQSSAQQIAPTAAYTQGSVSGAELAMAAPHTTALEQLFGPMPASRHNSPPDVFSDLYSFGLDTTSESPWDFFNIGMTAEGLLNGLRGLDGVNDTGAAFGDPSASR